MVVSKNTRFRVKAFVAAALVAAALITGGCAAKTSKVFKIGILSSANAYIIVGDTFIKEMIGLGYVEGKNIVFDFQKTNADPAAEERVIKKFIADKVDLMFTLTTGTTITAKKLTEGTGIPLIFAVVTVEGSGLVESLRHPGGNITGVRIPGADVTLKRLEILLEIDKKVKRVWAPFKAQYSAAMNALETLVPAASAAHVTLVQAPFATVDEALEDLEARSRSRDPGMDAILIMPDALTQSQEVWPAISALAALHRLPIAGNAASQVNQGALFTYSADYAESGTLAASLADKIIKGVTAGTIPLVTPEAKLRINHKTASLLGLSISEGFLEMAVEIIR
jgi:putative ABC transport system substrate-binding protein